MSNRLELGEKLFEETGKITGFRITRVNPIEGIAMEVTFVSDIKEKSLVEKIWAQVAFHITQLELRML